MKNNNNNESHLEYLYRMINHVIVNTIILPIPTIWLLYLFDYIDKPLMLLGVLLVGTLGISVINLAIVVKAILRRLERRSTIMEN